MTAEHDDLREDVGLYVLGALAPDDRARVEAHLRTCDECAASARALKGVADELPYGVPLVDAPADLRSRIVAEASRVRPPRTSRTVLPFAPRVGRRPERSLVTFTGWIAAAASLVVAVGFGLRASDLRTRLGATEQQLTAALGRLRDAQQELQASLRETTAVRQTLAVLTTPDAVELVLAGQAPARQASARAFLSPSRGVLFAARQLPAVAAGRTYQVWYLTRGAPVSAGLIRPDADGGVSATFDAPDMSIVAGMAVSEEPEGGVPAPTGAIYLATQ